MPRGRRPLTDIGDTAPLPMQTGPVAKVNQREDGMLVFKISSGDILLRKEDISLLERQFREAMKDDDHVKSLRGVLTPNNPNLVFQK